MLTGKQAFEQARALARAERDKEGAWRGGSTAGPCPLADTGLWAGVAIAPR